MVNISVEFEKLSKKIIISMKEKSLEMNLFGSYQKFDLRGVRDYV
jgi:hypothetical protein